MIIKKVGIQITTTFALGRRKTQFVAWERIHDIVINEAITLVCISFRLFQMIIHDLSFFFHMIHLIMYISNVYYFTWLFYYKATTKMIILKELFQYSRYFHSLFQC